MKASARDRFILWATLGYILGGLAWIFFSDHLLGLMLEREALLRLSTVKGVFYVLFTAGLLLLALRAVPARHGYGRQRFSEALAAGLVSGRYSPWLTYCFALAISLAALWLRESMAQSAEGRPLLNMFILPIILSAFIGGFGPGLLATVTVGLGANYLLMPPLHAFALHRSLDQLQWGILLFNGAAISLLCGMLQNALSNERRNGHLLSSVVSSTSDAVFIKDLQGRYLLFNRAAADMVGRPEHDVLGRDDRALFPDESVQTLVRRDREVLLTGRTQTHEESLEMPNGQVGVFLVTKGPARDASGRVYGVFGIARDITERHQAAAALQASEAALREAQRLAGIGSWSWNLQSGEHAWSPQIYQIYGRDPALPPAGYPEVRQYFSAESWSLLAQQIEAAIASQHGYECDAEVLRADGSRRWVTARGEVSLAADGAVAGLHGTLQDITARKLAELRMQASEERLRLVVAATSDGVWDWDLRNGSVYRSAQYYELVRTTPEEDTHDFAFFQRLVHPEDLPGVLECIRHHQQDVNFPLEFDFRLAAEKAPGRWLRGRGRVVTFDEQGAPARMVGTLVDITEHKHAELAQRLATTVFDNSFEGIMVAEPDGRIVRVNPAFSRITGYSAAEAVGQTPRLLSSGRHGQAFYAQMWASVRQHGFWQGEIWNRRKTGEIYAEQLAITTVNNSRGEIVHYIGVFSDISQIKAHESELDRIAHYDSLTGTPNRRLLTDRLAQSIGRTKRSSNSLAICYLDLDGFKAVNDRYGHAAGDQLLVGVAESIKGILRAEDTLARLGGDEFVLLLADIASPEECSQILDRVLAAIAQPVMLDEQLVSITASIGVSLYPEDDANADTLLRHADQAMYQAKENGKNHYQLFDPENDRKAQHHRRYLDELRLALEGNEFVLYYQPKINLADGTVFGVEALIRWNHPQRGLVSPAEFLPHINGSNLEQPLGEWVINTALAQVAIWHTAGSSLRVSVNVSANHLLHPDFCNALQAALARYPGLPAACLELEVLESAAIADMDHAVEVLQNCRQLGVHFSLDDFGTGYSSLTYLRKLPVDTLKIDQSFVRGMLHSPDDLGIVEAVIRMAAVSDRQVIAEGVETLEHATALFRLGCNQAQGYGIARPMAADQLEEWMAGWQEQTEWHSLGGNC